MSNTHLNVNILGVPHLSEYGGQGCRELNTYFKRSRDKGEPVRYLNYQNETDYLVCDIVRRAGSGSDSVGFVRAGPRERRFFGCDAVAAVVTCGGLCPGLNNVIKEIVLALNDLYGVTNILGIRHGFWGFSDGSEPLHLTSEFVNEIDRDGGTILGSDRGGMLGYEEKILEVRWHGLRVCPSIAKGDACCNRRLLCCVCVDMVWFPSLSRTEASRCSL